jgi:hypothetical protein
MQPILKYLSMAAIEPVQLYPQEKYTQLWLYQCRTLQSSDFVTELHQPPFNKPFFNKCNLTCKDVFRDALKVEYGTLKTPFLSVAECYIP